MRDHQRKKINLFSEHEPDMEIELKKTIMFFFLYRICNMDCVNQEKSFKLVDITQTKKKHIYLGARRTNTYSNV